METYEVTVNGLTLQFRAQSREEAEMMIIRTLSKSDVDWDSIRLLTND